MLVKASRTGILNEARKREGEVFEIEPDRANWSWMKPEDDEAKELFAKAPKASRPKSMLDLMQEVSELKAKIAKLTKGKGEVI